MKRITIAWITILAFLLGLAARGQDGPCKVLVDELGVAYSGDCKKGLAHGEGEATGPDFSYKGEFKKGYPEGEGTLTMKNGDVFTGEWNRGLVYGEGVLTKGNGTVVRGYFKGSISGFVYMGTEKADLAGYKIIEKVRMENATIDFIKSEEQQNTIVIYIQENVIRQIDNFEIVSMTSGTVQRLTNSGGRLTAEIENIDFPVTFRIQYVLPYGGLENTMAPVLFRFTVSEPGFWKVNITHR